MNVLKQLTLEQIKALTHEEIHELIKSRSEAEIEYDRENIPVLIDYINNFFRNCICFHTHIYVQASRESIFNVYGAIALGHVQKAHQDGNFNIELNNKIRKFINKTETVTMIMDKIMKDYAKINQKLYIMFIPTEIKSKGDILLLRGSSIKLECQCNNMITYQEYINSRCSAGLTNPLCPLKNCFFASTGNGKIERYNPQYTVRINEGRADTKQSYNIRGYKLYKAADFIIMTAQQIKEKYNIANIEEFVINPIKQDINSFDEENHVYEYVLSDKEMNKYILPWKILDMSIEEAPKEYDFSEYFNFIDMIRFKKYMKKTTI